MALLAPVLLAATLGAATPTAGCATTDLMPDFWRYWDRARSAAPADRYRLFEEMVQKPNAAVYAGAFANAPIDPSEFVTEALKRVPKLEPRMRALSGELAADLPSELAAFRKTFPKFRCSVPVYFMFSGGAFDGGTRDVSGKTALMFGLDVIAKLNEELSPLVVHELFHVYHNEVVAEDPDTFSWGLWTEGLATYVSRRLNPKIPEQKVCCMPPIEPIRAQLPRLSGEALALLDSTDHKSYARFFLGGQEIDIPQRSGYYLGYLIASEAGKSRSLEELAELTPAEVRTIEKAELERLRAADAAPKDLR